MTIGEFFRNFRNLFLKRISLSDSWTKTNCLQNAADSTLLRGSTEYQYSYRKAYT